MDTMDPIPPHRRPRRKGTYNRQETARCDQDLVTGLQLEASCGIENGDAWRLICEHVHHYGHAVLMAKILDGSVWSLYRRLVGGRPAGLRNLDRDMDREDAYDLAADVVLEALPRLRHHLISGRWDPTGGASIRTWFVNLAILRLPCPWRTWEKQQVARLPSR